MRVTFRLVLLTNRNSVCFSRTEAMAPASALPIGAKRVVSEMQPISVDPSIPGSGLLNRVLAIMSPFNPDENERYDEEILDLTVEGFIVVCVVSCSYPGPTSNLLYFW